jgi:hypothetical protein
MFEKDLVLVKESESVGEGATGKPFGIRKTVLEMVWNVE